MFHRIRRRRIAFFGAAVILSFGAAHAAMTTTGQFAVTNSGAATYTVPIQVPPGTAGMAPQLAIAYSNQAGNGLLGIGGSLQGMSAITRCPRTMVQDRVRGGVNYDANDRYCLDGQRLIAVAGIDGGNGTEYRTELNGFSRIKSYGSAGSGPAWFVVETKGGDLLEYGKAVDTRIEAQGKDSIAVWALGRRQDALGNYLTIGYTKDAANGSYWPTRIDYAGNIRSGLQPYNAVTFQYDQRGDITPFYSAGSLVKASKLLRSVQTYTGNRLIKSYNVKYSQVAPTQRSLMNEVQECAGSGACLPAVTFQAAGISPPLYAFSNASAGDPGLAGLPPNGANVTNGTTEIIDINGDGLPDVVISASWAWGSRTQQEVYLNTGTSFVRSDSYSNTLPAGAYLDAMGLDKGVRLIDVNGDGLPDIVQSYCQYYKGCTYTRGVWLNTGSSFEFNESYTASLVKSGFMLAWSANMGNGDRGTQTYTELIDLDGDGLPDLVHYGYAGGEVFLNTGSGFEYSAAYSNSLKSLNLPDCVVCVRLSDVNGDGLLDIVALYSGSKPQSKFPPVKKVYLNTGSGFSFDATFSNSLPDTYFGDLFGDRGTRLVDLNGDGLPDLIQMFVPADWIYGEALLKRVYLNTGKQFVFDAGYTQSLPDTWFTLEGSATADDTSPPRDLGTRLVDMNGDGLLDIIQLTPSNTSYPSAQGVYLNTGTGFVYSPSISSVLPAGHISSYYGDGGTRLIDLNGDGMPDIVSVPDSTFLNRHSTTAAYITGITELGLTTRISYAPITNKNVYAKDSNISRTAQPNVDLQSATHVVASVTLPNGAGGTLTSNYTYGGLKYERDGHGVLGYRWMQSAQVQTNTVTRTEFRQDWPYIGLTSSITRTLPGGGNNGVLSTVTNNYGCIDQSSGADCTVGAGKIYSTYLRSSVSTAWDMNGAALPSASTTYQFDRWGNPIMTTEMVEGSLVRTTANTYLNDETKWFLGKVTSTMVKAYAPFTSPFLPGVPSTDPGTPLEPAVPKLSHATLMAIVMMILESE